MIAQWGSIWKFPFVTKMLHLKPKSGKIWSDYSRLCNVKTTGLSFKYYCLMASKCIRVQQNKLQLLKTCRCSCYPALSSETPLLCPRQQRAARNDIQKRVNFCWWLNPHKSILLTQALTSKSGPIQCCPKTGYYVF